MRHCGGQGWSQWNDKLQQLLVPSQVRDGVEQGSWYFSHARYAEQGGRLMHTALATLILESYYRHMPHHSHHRPGT